jgi:hypothetical protein
VTTAPSQNSRKAGERFFRLYHRHCLQPNLDTLFSLLEAIHSLNDRIRKETRSDFFGCNEFVALKALRNLFHHETELIHEVRLIPVDKLAPIVTDLAFLCLVPRHLVEKSIEQIDQRRREQDAVIIRSSLKWYGNVVNINPCIFNFAVHVFEKLRLISVDLEGDEYGDFQASYEFEEEHGHSHFVSGDIVCGAGSIDAVLEVAFSDVI